MATRHYTVWRWGVRATVTKTSGSAIASRPELLAGTILVFAHNNAEGDALLRNAASISHDKLPHRLGLEGEALSSLAQSLLGQGKVAEALAVNERARRLFQEAFGARAGGHPLFLATQSRRDALQLAKFSH